jgi:hypothetical protein
MNCKRYGNVIVLWDNHCQPFIICNLRRTVPAFSPRYTLVIIRVRMLMT